MGSENQLKPIAVIPAEAGIQNPPNQSRRIFAPLLALSQSNVPNSSAMTMMSIAMRVGMGATMMAIAL
jgi:hypothetical protein